MDTRNRYRLTRKQRQRLALVVVLDYLLNKHEPATIKELWMVLYQHDIPTSIRTLARWLSRWADHSTHTTLQRELVGNRYLYRAEPQPRNSSFTRILVLADYYLGA